MTNINPPQCKVRQAKPSLAGCLQPLLQLLAWQRHLAVPRGCLWDTMARPRAPLAEREHGCTHIPGAQAGVKLP